MYKNSFYYRILKEAGVGWDNDLNEACDVYMELKITSKKPLSKEISEKAHLKIINSIGEKLEINSEYLVPISYTEYEQEDCV
jgi:hypothetical protein